MTHRGAVPLPGARLAHSRPKPLHTPLPPPAKPFALFSAAGVLRIRGSGSRVGSPLQASASPQAMTARSASVLSLPSSCPRQKVAALGRTGFLMFISLRRLGLTSHRPDTQNSVSEYNLITGAVRRNREERTRLVPVSLLLLSLKLQYK